MPWVRLEDSFYAHPKVLPTPIAAIGLHVLALCYSSSHLTDGYISPSSLRYLQGTPRLAGTLVQSGLWETLGEGWRIHDFLDYNPSKAEAVEKRKRISLERSKAGSNGAAKRWQSDSNAIAPSPPSHPTRPGAPARARDSQKMTTEEYEAEVRARVAARTGVPA